MKENIEAQARNQVEKAVIFSLGGITIFMAGSLLKGANLEFLYHIPFISVNAENQHAFRESLANAAEMVGGMSGGWGLAKLNTKSNPLHSYYENLKKRR